jgi:hypothetical protein
VKSLDNDKQKVFRIRQTHRHLFHSKNICPPPLPYFKVNIYPFSSSPLRLYIFRLFVILSLTQLYRYTPEIFLVSTATFKYTYRAPSDKLDKKLRFSEKIKMWKVNGWRWTPSDGKSSYCLWQGLLKRILKCEYLLVMYRTNMLHYIRLINF